VNNIAQALSQPLGGMTFSTYIKCESLKEKARGWRDLGELHEIADMGKGVDGIVLDTSQSCVALVLERRIACHRNYCRSFGQPWDGAEPAHCAA
jgi:hypothetical protein